MKTLSAPTPCTVLHVDFKSRKLTGKDILDNRYKWKCTCCNKHFTHIPNRDNVGYVSWEGVFPVGEKTTTLDVNICEECVKQLSLALEGE